MMMMTMNDTTHCLTPRWPTRCCGRTRWRLCSGRAWRSPPRWGGASLTPAWKRPVSNFDCEKDDSAFNLILVSELAPLHRGGPRQGVLRHHEAHRQKGPDGQLLRVKKSLLCIKRERGRGRVSVERDEDEVITHDRSAKIEVKHNFREWELDFTTKKSNTNWISQEIWAEYRPHLPRYPVNIHYNIQCLQFLST